MPQLRRRRSDDLTPHFWILTSSTRTRCRTPFHPACRVSLVSAFWPTLPALGADIVAGMRSVEEHLAAVLGLAERLGPVEVPVRAEPGVVLAADVVARLAVPPFDNSAMDGFAVRAADVTTVPVALDVVGDIPAGSFSEVVLAAGQAIRIMTGSPLPAGADAVVPVEDTDQLPGDVPLPEQVEIRAVAGPGAHIRRRAEDVAVGDVVLRAGSAATPAAAAGAASVGLGVWSVVPRPRVLVVATGDELVAPGLLPGPGQIPDSNGLLLDGLLRSFGADVVGVLRTRDDVAGFRSLLEAAPEADLIVTTGGVSAGAFEVVRQATAGAVDFVKVAMQPGKPQGLGHWTSGTSPFSGGSGVAGHPTPPTEEGAVSAATAASSSGLADVAGDSGGAGRAEVGGAALSPSGGFGVAGHPEPPTGEVPGGVSAEAVVADHPSTLGSAGMVQEAGDVVAAGVRDGVAGVGRQVPLLALPGNPVSVFVSAWLFVRPLVARLAGRDPALTTVRVPALEGWRSPPGRRQYVPVRITPDGVRRAHALGSGSHAIASLHLADGLAVVPAEVDAVMAGELLDVIPTAD